MTRKKDLPAVEWTGGLTSLPALITGEDEPHRPEALIWICADGCLQGHEVDAPGEVVGRAAASLRRAIEQPMVGRPRAPGLIAALLELARVGDDGDEAGEDSFDALQGELFRRSVRSGEAKGLADPEWTEMILGYATDYLGVSVATLEARELEEIVFEVIPRKVSVAADVAPSIIAESLAFWSFLKREAGLAQAGRLAERHGAAPCHRTSRAVAGPHRKEDVKA